LKAHRWPHICERSSLVLDNDEITYLYLFRQTPGDGGIDIFGTSENFFILIQCKDHQRVVGKYKYIIFY